MFVVILGAGPAGMTCANALLTFGIESLLVESSEHFGGAQRTNFHPNLWLLGAPEESGRAMTERVVSHFLSLPIATRLATRLTAVQADATGFVVHTDGPRGNEIHHADALVLATGMHPHATPDLQDLARKSERIIIGPLSDAIRDRVHKQRVLILGGGDNALDHALYLVERGNTITVRTRGRFSARPHFVSACARPGITLMEAAPVQALKLSDQGIRDETDDYDWLLVMFGYRPNTDFLECFDPRLRPVLTESGHIAVDASHACSVGRIYAIGDIVPSLQPSVLTAMAHGLTVAKAISMGASGSPPLR